MNSNPEIVSAGTVPPIPRGYRIQSRTPPFPRWLDVMANLRALAFYHTLEEARDEIRKLDEDGATQWRIVDSTTEAVVWTPDEIVESFLQFKAVDGGAWNEHSSGFKSLLDAEFYAAEHSQNYTWKLVKEGKPVRMVRRPPLAGELHYSALLIQGTPLVRYQGKVYYVSRRSDGSHRLNGATGATPDPLIVGGTDRVELLAYRYAWRQEFE